MKGRIRRGILTAAAVLAVLVGFLLWVCWDEAVYPLKNHLARQEWQRIVDTVPRLLISRPERRTGRFSGRMKKEIKNRYKVFWKEKACMFQ